MDENLRNELLDRGVTCFTNNQFTEAITHFRQIIDQDPTDWNAKYLVGQCYRFLGDYPTAISYLEKALSLRDDESSVYHELGVAYQLNGDYSDSLDALAKGKDLDPENEVFYISYAMTRKAQGEYEKALGNYQSAFKMLGNRITRFMRNSRRTPIFPHPECPFHLWMDCAIEGAMYSAVTAGYLKGVEFPTGQMAEEELITKQHEGLCWIIREDFEGNMFQLYLPNYFNTFFVILCRDESVYYELIGNMSTVLSLLGRDEEAKEYREEAEFFMAKFTEHQSA